MTHATRRAALSMLALAAAAAAMALAPRPGSGGADPQSTSATLTWTANVLGNYTWDYASTVAAPNHTESVWVDPPGAWVVYDDWRLPTAQEVIDAVNDGSYGYAGAPGTFKHQYTNIKRRGNWITVVTFSCDANGYPVPGSAVVNRIASTWATTIKFVRP